MSRPPLRLIGSFALCLVLAASLPLAGAQGSQLKRSQGGVEGDFPRGEVSPHLLQGSDGLLSPSQS
jgi:hypothetical protein